MMSGPGITLVQLSRGVYLLLWADEELLVAEVDKAPVPWLATADAVVTASAMTALRALAVVRLTQVTPDSPAPGSPL
jgi:hypothetical protein